MTKTLSEALAPTRERRCAHDPDRVLRDLCVSIADGGECVCGLGVLRDQEVLFGAVASETTAHRVAKLIDEGLLGEDQHRPRRSRRGYIYVGGGTWPPADPGQADDCTATVRHACAVPTIRS